jgi:glyoxylase-like metal-dependent hydrolase (beta-lactamase superfamily II)
VSTLDFTVFDLDFPVGSKNKTATLVTGENEALLVDAGFTRADGHRLAAAVLDSGKKLTTVYISHEDPDFYFGVTLLDEMAALDPVLVVPGHRLPGTAADASAITATRDYLTAFEQELGKAADGAALTDALVKRYPANGMLIAAQIGAKVAKGEMKWG